MKEQVIPGLTVSGLHCPPVSDDSSAVTPQSITADPSVSMSNLELLGNVAFAMSRGSDGADNNGSGQPVVVSTNPDGVVLAESDGQIPDHSNVIYIFPTGDADAAMAAEAADNVVDNDCAVTDLSSIANNTASIYFNTLPDSYDSLCNVGPIQLDACGAVPQRSDDLANMDADLSTAVVSTADGSFVHSVDLSLDPFSLAVLTNAGVTS